MPEKKSFVLRISQEDYDRLKKWADDEFRSVNGQLEFIIHNALLNKDRKKEILIRRDDLKNNGQK